MRRIVVEKGYANNHGEYLQLCIVYPTEMNLKQVQRENLHISKRIGIVSFENKKPKYTEVTK
jgi:hypothetical protein